MKYDVLVFHPFGKPVKFARTLSFFKHRITFTFFNFKQVCKRNRIDFGNRPGIRTKREWCFNGFRVQRTFDAFLCCGYLGLSVTVDCTNYPPRACRRVTHE